MVGENDREMGEMEARIKALERAVAQLLADRDRMFSILDENKQTLAVAVHRLNDISDDTHDYLHKCEACRNEIVELKATARRKPGLTSGHNRVLNPLDKPLGTLLGDILVSALKLVGVGVIVALIVLGVGAM